MKLRTIILLLLLAAAMPSMHAREPVMIDPSTGVIGAEYSTINFTSANIQMAGVNLPDPHKETITTTDPSATDDSAAGYSIGSRWLNTTTDILWHCLDDTATAAVWKQATNAAVGAATMNTVKADDVQVGDGDIVTIDFSTDFGVAESPDTEIQITIDAGITRDTEWDTFAELNAVLGLDADIETFALPASTTISAFGATMVDDADAATARATLGVDAAGTDNSTNVTLAGTPDYITIAGQVITRGQIDLATDVTGALPDANVANDLTLGGATIATSTITLYHSANPTPTAEGEIYWDDDDDVLKIGDGTGTVSIGAGGSGGDVIVSGTPADGYLAVWTDATHIEGTSELTFDGTTDTLDIIQSGNLHIGGVSIIDDNAGDTQLENIDSLDATTENTVEAAIDTLTNLVTVGTIGTGTWQGNAIADTYVADNITLAGATIGTSAITLVQSTTPAPTAEGVVEWDTDGNNLAIGDGAATQIFSPDSALDSEAELESRLSDVTNVFTDNDGALDDDDVTAADVGLASPDLDDTTAAIIDGAVDFEEFGEVTLVAVVGTYQGNLTTGNGQAPIVIPGWMTGTWNLTAVHVSVDTAGSAGSNPSWQIYNQSDAANMLTTVVSIDLGETGSDTATTAYVIDTANDDVTAYKRLRIDCTLMSSTPAKGFAVFSLDFSKQ